jgi:hypothetical protein
VNEPKAERQVALPIPKLDESRNFKLDMIAIEQLEVQIPKCLAHRFNHDQRGDDRIATTVLAWEKERRVPFELSG